MDTLSSEQRSKLMSKIRTKNTKPEMVVRRILHRMGFRFRLHRKNLPGKPDIVLPKYRIAIFVHGCLWHGHECPRGKRPMSNEAFWAKKIGGNIERDRQTQQSLLEIGWKVLVIWECRIKNTEWLIGLVNSLTQANDEKAASHDS